MTHSINEYTLFVDASQARTARDAIALRFDIDSEGPLADNYERHGFLIDIGAEGANELAMTLRAIGIRHVNLAPHLEDALEELDEMPNDIEPDCDFVEQVLQGALETVTSEPELLDIEVDSDMDSQDIDKEVHRLLADSDVGTFHDRGIMTHTRGLVLTLADGSEYQITIVQSKRARE